MKTIALKEHTFELLEDLKEKEKLESYDKLVLELIRQKNKVPKSMFGSLKGKAKSFTSRERREMWKDHDFI
jgi:predicted CopG family antitoxin